MAGEAEMTRLAIGQKTAWRCLATKEEPCLRGWKEVFLATDQMHEVRSWAHKEERTGMAKTARIHDSNGGIYIRHGAGNRRH